MSDAKKEAPSSKEELEIRLRQSLNDLRITQEESRENSVKYMELVCELGERNLELQALKDGLEDVLRARNAELLLAREGDGRFQKGSANRDASLEAALAPLKKAAEAKGCSVALSCQGADARTVSLLRACSGRVAEALLSCCAPGCVLEVSSLQGGGFSIEPSGSGVDGARLGALLRTLKALQRDWAFELLSGLSGWVLSAGSSGVEIKPAPPSE